jgi:hypothetical protein
MAETATAQLGVVLGPISSVSTPIAGLVQAGPTQTGSDIETGVDPLGTGAITMSGFGSQMHDGIVETVSTAKAFILGLIDLGAYAPWITPIPVMLMVATVIAMFIPLMSLIIKAAAWLINLLMKIATILSALKFLAKILG